MVKSSPNVAKATKAKRVSNVAKATKAKRVSTVPVGRSKPTTARGKGIAHDSTKATGLSATTPTARNTGNVSRNTLAATRKRVSTSNLGISDRNPLG